MEYLNYINIPKMFNSIVLETQWSCDYTTIYHFDCGHTFGGKWDTKYNYFNGYTTAAKYYTCPKCGVHSSPDVHKVFSSHREEKIYPISMFIEVINYKHFLDLRIKYRGIQLFMNGTKSEEKTYCETMRYDFKKKCAIFIDRDRNRHEISVAYLRGDGYEEHGIMPVLTYLGSSYAVHSVNKKRLNDVFKTLRTTFEKRLEETYGFKSKGAYISPSVNEEGGYFSTMLINMAFKIAAPDMPSITKIIESTNRWSDNYCLKRHIPFSDCVFEDTKKGMNFVQSLMKQYHAPNSRSLRKAMSTDIMAVNMTNVLNLFKDENIRRTILTLDRTDSVELMNSPHYRSPYTGKVLTAKSIRDVMAVTTQLVKDMWSKLIDRHGETGVLNYLLSADYSEIRDIPNMYLDLKPKYRELVWRQPCKLKKFHDLLVNIYNKQEYGDINLPIIEKLNADIDGMHFVIPRTAADLLNVGKSLNNCVGSYKDRVMKGSVAIVVVTDDNMKPVACLELNKNGKNKFSKLVQAKLFANKRVSENEQINTAVMKWANQLKIQPHTVDIEAHVS